MIMEMEVGRCRLSQSVSQSVMARIFAYVHGNRRAAPASLEQGREKDSAPCPEYSNKIPGLHAACSGC